MGFTAIDNIYLLTESGKQYKETRLPKAELGVISAIEKLK